LNQIDYQNKYNKKHNQEQIIKEKIEKDQQQKLINQ